MEHVVAAMKDMLGISTETVKHDSRSPFNQEKTG